MGMMRWAGTKLFNALPVSALRLLGCTVQHGRRRVRGVSFFPFFERTGEVRRIMYVSADSADIYTIAADAPLPRASCYKRIQFPESVSLFTPLRKTDLADLAKLWHYDPRWVLDEERFTGHWARRQLKLTNCATRTKKKLTTLYYRRDLTRIQGMAHQDESGNPAASRWDELQLETARPTLLEPRARRKASSMWVLDPIWKRR